MVILSLPPTYYCKSMCERNVCSNKQQNGRPSNYSCLTINSSCIHFIALFLYHTCIASASVGYFCDNTQRSIGLAFGSIDDALN